jgi:hypothetical protein
MPDDPLRRVSRLATHAGAGQACACPCGAARFFVRERPRARILCHCNVCQSVYRARFADVSVMWGGDIVLADEAAVTFRRYRAPPALRRGTCSTCGAPVVGFLGLAPFVRLAFVPSRNIPDPHALPAPAMHIFYHRRLADIEDDLPKHFGYWASQSAVARLLLPALFRGAPT